MRHPSDRRTPCPSIRGSVRLQGQAFEVNGNVDGVSGIFFLDTGPESAFSLEPEFVQQNKLVEPLGALGA
jgi:hypothetical protein